MLNPTDEFRLEYSKLLVLYKLSYLKYLKNYLSFNVHFSTKFKKQYKFTKN